MKQIDIINVAGLLMDGEDDGIEKELREKVNPRYIKTLAPTPLRAATEHPNQAIERLVSMIRDLIGEIERQFGESRVVVVGRSYGAFMALLASIRMDFQKILRTVLIEGPLHPDVTVKPPFLIPPLRRCGIHYDNRSELAQEAVDKLKELGTSRVAIVQGGMKDDVVSLDAQLIPGDFKTVDMSNSFANAFAENGSHGLIFKLPPDIGGRNKGVRKIFPEGYRNHLFWTQEKMDMVRSVIENSAN